MTRRHADESDFDLRTRAELALACEPGEPPAHLFRKAPLLGRRGVLRLGALVLAGGAIGAVLALRPPELVRGAIEHEYYERTLRGNFIEAKPLLEQLGLADQKTVPGFPQLMRICDIEDHLVYHLTTFFERGGMVTVFAFEQPVGLKEEGGWWGNVYWQVVTSREGKPLVLVSQQKKALAAARARFARPPA
jgi:hypothetical protein